MSFDIVNAHKDVPADNGVIIYWLGGAGFVFKFAGGETVCIDPYLSDFAERVVGFRRLSLAPIKASELVFDLLLITHTHPDHLDADSFDILTKSNPASKVIASQDCAEFLKENKGVNYQIVSPGDVSQFDNLSVRVVDADHGDLCPEAIGFVIGCAGRSLYFTGDTAFNEKLLAEPIAAKPEIIIPCINGAFGNMNAKEAAVLARKCRSKVAVPCHFWLFAEHGGSPAEFKEYLNAESPETELLLLTPGRGIEV